MCARIYLNGDGIGKNTHISLFFVSMRGEYDNLLKCPFQGKVTFSLLDQRNEAREDVQKDFLVDLSVSRTNGLSIFCPLQRLYSQAHEYVKDDCMFIKLRFDATN